VQALEVLQGRLRKGMLRNMNQRENPAVRDVPLQQLPEVKGLVLFGFTFYKHGHWDQDLSSSAHVPPVLLINGAADEGAATAHGTLQRLPAPKASAVLRDLDHFSAADRKWLARDEPEPKLGRADQVRRVARVAALWLDALAASKEEEGSRSLDAARQIGKLPFVTEFEGDLSRQV
jgi:hypothetical protein